MKRRLWISGLLSMAMLTACVSSIPLEVRVGINQSGGAISMHQGQELIVELHRGNDPAYAWHVTAHGAMVFGEPTKQVIQLSGQSVATERFVFTAMHMGDDVVRIAQRAVDGSSDGPAREFILRVTVRK